MNSVQMIIQTNIGPLYLVASERGLKGVFWEMQSIAFFNEDQSIQHLNLLRAKDQIIEYLNGARREFTITLDIVGTDFQKKVWEELLNIPYGHTGAYKDVAIAIGKPKAFRAVGTANGKNPLCLIIPCHRVIANDGKMGGYSGGLEIKQRLLSLEKNSLSL